MKPWKCAWVRIASAAMIVLFPFGVFTQLTGRQGLFITILVVAISLPVDAGMRYHALESETTRSLGAFEWLFGPRDP